jgi:hypothetical protein
MALGWRWIPVLVGFVCCNRKRNSQPATFCESQFLVLVFEGYNKRQIF